MQRGKTKNPYTLQKKFFLSKILDNKKKHAILTCNEK